MAVLAVLPALPAAFGHGLAVYLICNQLALVRRQALEETAGYIAAADHHGLRLCLVDLECPGHGCLIIGLRAQRRSYITGLLAHVLAQFAKSLAMFTQFANQFFATVIIKAPEKRPWQYLGKPRTGDAMSIRARRLVRNNGSDNGKIDGQGRSQGNPQP